MLQPVNLVVVIVYVVDGLLLAGGNLRLVWHPTAFIIVGGAAIGTFVASDPPQVNKDSIEGLLAPMNKPRYGRATDLDLPRLLNDLLTGLRE